MKKDYKILNLEKKLKTTGEKIATYEATVRACTLSGNVEKAAETAKVLRMAKDYFKKWQKELETLKRSSK